MKVKIAIGWPEPTSVIWDEEATDIQLGGIINATLELTGVRVLVWRSEETDDQKPVS